MELYERDDSQFGVLFGSFHSKCIENGATRSWLFEDILVYFLCHPRNVVGGRGEEMCRCRMWAIHCRLFIEASLS